MHRHSLHDWVLLSAPPETPVWTQFQAEMVLPESRHRLCGCRPQTAPQGTCATAFEGKLNSLSTTADTVGRLCTSGSAAHLPWRSGNCDDVHFPPPPSLSLSLSLLVPGRLGRQWTQQLLKLLKYPYVPVSSNSQSMLSCKSGMEQAMNLRSLGSLWLPLGFIQLPLWLMTLLNS
eukprot:4764607-Amphidinium_carterae.1